MPLDFDVNIFRPEAGQSITGCGFAISQCYQSFGEFRKFAPPNAACSFFVAKVSPGQKLAKILVAGAGFDEHRQDALIFHRQFGADDGANLSFACAAKKSRRAVKAVAIAQRDGGHLQFGGAIDELLGQRCTAQKTEGAPAMEFDVISHKRLPGRIRRRNKTAGTNLPSAVWTSHSLRSQRRMSHQSPELWKGPRASTMIARSEPLRSKTGFSSRKLRAGRAGRRRRKAGPWFRSFLRRFRQSHQIPAGASESVGRYVASNFGEPTFSVPTSAVRRASVSAN